MLAFYQQQAIFTEKLPVKTQILASKQNFLGLPALIAILLPLSQKITLINNFHALCVFCLIWIFLFLRALSLRARYAKIHKTTFSISARLAFNPFALSQLKNQLIAFC